MPSSTTTMDPAKTKKYVDDHFDSCLIKPLQDFIRIPNLTPMVDPAYLTNGLLQKAEGHIDQYAKSLQIEGITKHRFDLGGTAPPMNIWVVEPFKSTSKKNVMLYAHLDKQPYGTGWITDPCDPVIKDGRMYGRGTSDDGYAIFAALFSIKTCQAMGQSHPRTVLVVEAEEESGSFNLLPLLKEAEHVIKNPDVLFCFDAGCLDYERMWICSSLRGCIGFNVTVEVAKSSYHSGVVGGIVPETARIMRHIMDKIDDSTTGEIKPEFLKSTVPPFKMKEAEFVAEKFGKTLYTQFDMVDGAHCMHEDNLKELYLSSVWYPNMSVTGADGYPSISMAGNAVRASTSHKLSIRLPPNVDSKMARRKVEELIVTDNLYGAKVTVEGDNTGDGFCLEEVSPDMHSALAESAHFFDGREYKSYGMGGSIPFLAELKRKFPKTEIIATGALGPETNAHGPNEMLDVEFTRRLICCWAHMLHKQM